MMPWWQTSGLWLLEHIRAVLAGVGFTGGGVGLIKLMKHWPAPKKKSIYVGVVFDTIQDVMSNNERIGQRRDADSAFMTATTAGDKVESSVSAQASTETVEKAKSAAEPQKENA